MNKKLNITYNLYHNRKGLKATAALLPLLGITFFLGFFIHLHSAVGYAYVLLNSIQVRCLHDNKPVALFVANVRRIDQRHTADMMIEEPSFKLFSKLAKMQKIALRMADEANSYLCNNCRWMLNLKKQLHALFDFVQICASYGFEESWPYFFMKSKAIRFQCYI